MGMASSFGRKRVWDPSQMPPETHRVHTVYVIVISVVPKSLVFSSFVLDIVSGEISPSITRDIETVQVENYGAAIC